MLSKLGPAERPLNATVQAHVFIESQLTKLLYDERFDNVLGFVYDGVTHRL